MALKVRLYGRNKTDLLSHLSEFGLEIDEESPDVIISYGGDGTLLSAEREWPGVPKVALRDSRGCHVCSHHSNETILRHLAEGHLKRTEFIKLRAETKSESLLCLNDAIIHNARFNAGVRYRVWIDDEPYGSDEIIGDGLVVSTPFGASAYYRSITRSIFRVGIGLAFNNSIEPINHLVLHQNSIIRIRIIRGPAMLGIDNSPEHVHLAQEDEVTVFKAEQSAIILMYDRSRFPTKEQIY